MFVTFEAKTTSWRKINNTYGVTKIITFDNKPIPIANKYIEDMRNLYGVDGTLVLQNFAKGNHLKVTSGPFSNF